MTLSKSRAQSAQYVLLLIVGLTLIVGSGCTKSFDSKTGLMSFFGPKTDHVPGIMTPSERLKIIEQRAERASELPPNEQIQIAKDTANEFRNQSDPNLRRGVLYAMSSFPGPEFDAILREASTDTDHSVRIEACRLWGDRTGAEASQRLRDMLTDTDQDVKMAAIQSLGHIGGQEAVVALGDSLDSRDPAVQQQAVIALKECTGEDFGNDARRWKQFIAGEVPDPVQEISIAQRAGALWPF